MASNKVVVTFSRIDGNVVNAEVREGLSVGALLKALKYGEQEISSMTADLRINGEFVEDVLNYALKSNDFIQHVPAVKGGLK